ncbi:MAG TPA: CAP domain-containing protein [Candidatus Saccharimonadales bacterium]|nr:CAP domain-containing protein [Candidatus Saccharimonadales bacterium]
MKKRTLGALILALVCSVGIGGQAAAALPAGTAIRSGIQADLVVLVNGYRAANGLGPVSLNGSLSSAAAWMANDMATKNYFSHTSSDGRSPQQRMAAFGYPAYALYTGENIAAGQASPADVLAGWKASPAHNTILLSANFNAIGVGYASSATSTYRSYWVADLGGPGGNVAAPPVVAPPVVAPPVVAVSAPAPVDPAPAAAAVPATFPQEAASAQGAGIDQTPPAVEARAATVARGEARGSEAIAEAARPDGFSLRRLLHLLEVLDRLDHPH